MAKRLTEKQESFTLFIFKGMNQREAYVKAGYAFKSSLAVMDANASRLANNEKVKTRLAELQKRAEDASVMSVLERKQRLTEMARGDLADFVDSDGGTITYGKDHPNHRAVTEFSIATTYTKKGEPIVTKSIKLYNPVSAIQELNKMEKIYTEGAQVNIDNRSINIEVVSDNAKQLAEALIEGKGT